MSESRASWTASAKGRSLAAIGSLEADILAIVWEHEPASVRAVYELLLRKRRIAYTTVMTVMGNLTRKGLLHQDRSAPTFIYTAALPQAEVVAQILDRVVGRLLGGRSELAVSALLGLEGELSAEQLVELRRHAQELLAR